MPCVFRSSAFVLAAFLVCAQARADMAAFETQGRFIESRYGRDEIDASADHS